MIKIQINQYANCNALFHEFVCKNLVKSIENLCLQAFPESGDNFANSSWGLNVGKHAAIFSKWHLYS